ncbi:MAG: hypothetical protein EPN91_07490 [Salinibacterium sp.]|nr:MAG: hypothetical protein EPN91_07490 [Salinibacterium sp.]
MPFDIKAWLDQHVAIEEVLGVLDPLVVHAPLWHGNPPAEVLVFLLASECGTWGPHIQRLLGDGWRFDFLRDVAAVVVDGRRITIFGGDGAPFFDVAGMSSVRLWKKVEDGVNLILQIGARWPDGIAAAAGVKGFFGLFDEGALEMVAKYTATFGSA